MDLDYGWEVFVYFIITIFQPSYKVCLIIQDFSYCPKLHQLLSFYIKKLNFKYGQVFIKNSCMNVDVCMFIEIGGQPNTVLLFSVPLIHRDGWNEVFFTKLARTKGVCILWQIILIRVILVKKTLLRFRD